MIKGCFSNRTSTVERLSLLLISLVLGACSADDSASSSAVVTDAEVAASTDDDTATEQDAAGSADDAGADMPRGGPSDVMTDTAGDAAGPADTAETADADSSPDAALDIVGDTADATNSDTADATISDTASDTPNDTTISDTTISDTADATTQTDAGSSSDTADAGDTKVVPCPALPPPKLTDKPTQPIGAPVPAGHCSKLGWPGAGPANAPVFSEQTTKMGFGAAAWIETCILPADFTGDGAIDVVVVEQSAGPAKPRYLALFVNNGKGAFTPIRQALSGDDNLMGCIAADLNNDGETDVVLARDGGLQVFWNNKGKLVAGVDTIPTSVKGGSTAVAAADFNNDGWLDLVATPTMGEKPFYDFEKNPCYCVKADPPYAKCSGGACTPIHNKVFLLRNVNGKFKDVTPAGLATVKGDVWSLTVHDLDRDGWPDMFIGAEWGGHGWYRNDGGFTFTLRTTDIGMRAWGHVMGSSVTDFDGDGWFDLFVSDYGADTLYRGQPDGTFGNGSKAWNVWPASTTASGWGTVAADFNNDGRPDLVVANELVVTPESFWGKADWMKYKKVPGAGHALYHNTGTTLASQWLPLPNDAPVGGSAVVLGCADLDGDGDLDLLSTVPQGKLQAWRNDTANQGGTLRIRLISGSSSKTVDGAWVQVWAQGYVQERYMTSSPGKGGHGVYRLHFGLGSVKTVDEVIVRFATGQVVKKANVAAGSMLTIAHP